MKKNWFKVLSFVLCFSLLTSTAYAEVQEPTQEEVEMSVEMETEAEDTEDNDDEDLEEDENESEQEDLDEDEDEEKEEDEKDSKIKLEGLDGILEQVKGTPIEAEILTLVDTNASTEEWLAAMTKLTASLEQLDAEEVEVELEIKNEDGTEIKIKIESEKESKEDKSKESKEEKSKLKAELKAEKEQKKAELKALADVLKDKLDEEAEDEVSEDELTELVDVYDQIGEFEQALEVQKEALKKAKQDLKHYKKMAKLYEKMGKKGLRAYVNGVEPEFDVAPVVKDGRTLLPFRAISNALEAEVTYNAEEKSIIVSKAGVKVELIVGGNVAYVNGEEVELDVAAEMINNRTMVPVRFISEAFKSVVQYDSETETVIILDAEAEASLEAADETMPAAE
jgi:tetratricopeptide (TPR) repeat protein